MTSRQYNAAAHFIDGHLVEGRAERVAVSDVSGDYTYGALGERINRAGNALRSLGLRLEDRVALCMLDGIDFPSVFFGALKAGMVPIPLSTMLASRDYPFYLEDSRARAVVLSAALLDKLAPALAASLFLEKVIVAGTPSGPHLQLDALLAAASPQLAPAPTTADDVAFWLYSSGSTGTPKGVVHLHSHLQHTAELYGDGVLGVGPDDVLLSAPKLFFAYGLGNGMSFPFHAGARAVYLAERPTPQSVMAALTRYQPTLFFCVPTLFAAILADPALAAAPGSARLRCCVSAGEALPKELGERWQARFGVPILDGIGSTEMLHIFLSNRLGEVRYGTSGRPVPGYEVRLLDDDGAAVGPGEVGALWVRGPSSASHYWNQRQKSLETFQGPWTRTGDRYTCDADGYYTYCGRSDDMLKVSGQWVSPFEVESALLCHAAVLEAAVVGYTDEAGLIKPRACVVLKQAADASPALAAALQTFVKERLAPHKYPRRVEFLSELPKTATGKIQRFLLRS